MPLGEGGGSQIKPPTHPRPVVFQKMYLLKSSKDRAKPWLFVTFNIITNHIFPENFIEFSQVVQKI